MITRTIPLNSPLPQGLWRCLSSGGTGCGTPAAPAGELGSTSSGRTRGRLCTRSSCAPTLGCLRRSLYVGGPHGWEGCSTVTGLYWPGWQGEWPRSGWSESGRGGGLCWSPDLLQPSPEKSGETNLICERCTPLLGINAFQFCDWGT